MEAPSEKLDAFDTELEKMTMNEQLYAQRILNMPKPIQGLLEDGCKGMLRLETETLVSHFEGLIGSSEKACLCDSKVDSTIEINHNTIHDNEEELSTRNHTFDINFIRGAQGAYTRMNMHNAQVANPYDCKNILSVVLLTVQQRFLTAKKDIEGLILLLNQELVAKEYLMAKVKDLQDDLLVTNRKNEENLQQDILAEKGRVTKNQWDVDELLRKVLHIESRLKFEERERIHAESEKIAMSAERELLLQELNNKSKHLEKLEKFFKEVEMKSKTDLKVLIKEVKFLRKSQESIREELNHLIREKDEIEMVLQKAKQRREHAIIIMRKLLNDIGALWRRLQECSVNFLADEEEKFTVNPSSLPDALGLLITSDNRINLLMAEGEQLQQYDALLRSCFTEEDNTTSIVDDVEATYFDMRTLLAEIVSDNARLRGHMNAVLRCALKGAIQLNKEHREEVPSGKKLLRWFSQK